MHIPSSVNARALAYDVYHILREALHVCSFNEDGQYQSLDEWNEQQYDSHALLYEPIAYEVSPAAFITTMKIFRCVMAAILAAIVSLSTAAQPNWWDSSKSEEGVSLSAQLGLNLSRFTHVDRWNGVRAGVNVGIMAEKPIIKSFAVKAGILYTMKGTVGKNDGGFGGELTTTFSPSYLEIPLLASYRLHYNEAVSFTFDFGPYFAFGLHGKDVKKWKAGNVGSDTRDERDVFSDSQLKRFDFGFQFGPSVIFKNRYSAGLSFDCGVADISNMGGKVGNFTFMINLGYKFVSF